MRVEDTCSQSVLRCQRPAMRVADTSETTDTFREGSTHVCACACVTDYSQVSVVSIVSYLGFLCGSERRTLSCRGVLRSEKCPPRFTVASEHSLTVQLALVAAATVRVAGAITVMGGAQ